MEPVGFEPTTTCLQGRNSPTELRPQRALRRILHGPYTVAGGFAAPPASGQHGAHPRLPPFPCRVGTGELLPAHAAL